MLMHVGGRLIECARPGMLISDLLPPAPRSVGKGCSVAYVNPILEDGDEGHLRQMT